MLVTISLRTPTSSMTDNSCNNDKVHRRTKTSWTLQSLILLKLCTILILSLLPLCCLSFVVVAPPPAATSLLPSPSSSSTSPSHPLLISSLYHPGSPGCKSLSQQYRSTLHSTISTANIDLNNGEEITTNTRKKKVIIVGAGWGGLSAAHALSNSYTSNNNIEVTVIDASSRVGGLVGDGYTSINGTRKAEAGQHGFWDNYCNIFRLLNDGDDNKNSNGKNGYGIPGLDINDVLTGYAEQGQYSPRGLEAIWPIYRNQQIKLPTGLAQAAYTRFLNLSIFDRITALPLALALSEFDGTNDEAWIRYDEISFRDLCVKLGVSRKCYEEAFEPMILTGLFAPGAECSAAAALGMSYFFVLQNQNAFDVKWCRGNVGEMIFDPWVDSMEKNGGVEFLTSTMVTGFDMDASTGRISSVRCRSKSDGASSGSSSSSGSEKYVDQTLEADEVILAVGAKALNSIVRNSPTLARFAPYRRFGNLRGTSVLATRIYLDRHIKVPYTANACWGFDEGVGMTFFDIGALHGTTTTTTNTTEIGSVLEVDYYHASTLLALDDDAIVSKVKRDLDLILGQTCQSSSVIDAAVVRLPDAVNWYHPGSYKDMPEVTCGNSGDGISNLYFAGDVVRTDHGSWSQEKAFVTGMEAANLIMGRKKDAGILRVPQDEPHVKVGRTIVRMAREIIGKGVNGKNKSKGPSLVDFLW